MATIGQVLTTPEAGWKRIDDSDVNFRYENCSSVALGSAYMGTTHQFNASYMSYIKFNFTGTKLRLIFRAYNYGINPKISIDGGAKETIFANAYDAYNCIVYDNQALANKEHYAIIECDHVGHYFDALDIDSNSIFKNFSILMNVKNNIDDINNIGDYIPCEYVSTSGAVGTFQNLGSATKADIPISSTATPDGKFNWIYVGKDYLGRKKLIADRNIQHTLSWDTLNTAGICNSKSIVFYTSDLCIGGVAISGGDYSTNIATNAFDNSNATGWSSVQSGAEVNGIAYIGYNFGIPKHIRRITYVGENNPANQITSAKVQRFDGTVWIDVTTITLFNDTAVKQVFDLPISVSSNQWRLLANAGTGSSSWRTYEIEMMELSTFNLNNYYIRLLTGGILSTDKDNEWDKYIAESNLGGLITAGDNNIWNWNGIWSWTSTVQTPNTARTIRGGSSASGWSGNTTSSVSGANTSFRPVLIVETPSPPNTPTNLTYTTSGYNINYTWDVVAGATGYKLYSGATLIADVAINSYNELNSSEVSKDVYVIAYNNIGESAPSDILNVITVPKKPTDLILTQVQNGFQLDWTDNSSQEVGFRIERRTSGGSWQIVTNTTQTTYTDILTAQTNILYEYQICAYNITGDSAYTTWGISTIDSVILSVELQDSINKIIYTWEESIGVTGYKLHLTDINNNTAIITTTERSYEYNITTDECITAYVVAYMTNSYGDFTSSDSNSTTTTSSPRYLVTNLNYNIIRINDSVDINLSFNDNSIVEDGFKIRYKIDDGSYIIVDVPSTSKYTLNQSYNKTLNIDYNAIQSQITIEIAQYNNIAIGQYTNPITIIKPSNVFQVAYRTDLGGAYFGWYGVPNITDYELVYRIDGGTELSAIIPLESGINNKFNKKITLDAFSEIEGTVYPRVNGFRQISTLPLTISKNSYTKPQVPSNFASDWYDEKLAKYTWENSNLNDIGYVFSYRINQETSIDVDITASDLLNTIKYYSSIVSLSYHLDTAYAKVKAYNLVDESNYTNEIQIIYVEVLPDVPTSFRKEYDTNFELVLKWDNMEYIDHYELHYFIDNNEYIVNIIENEFKVSFDYYTVKDFMAYVIAKYVGGKTSDATSSLVFVPTTKLDTVHTFNTNVDEKEELINSAIVTQNTISQNKISINTFTQDVINFIGKIATSSITSGIEKFGKILTTTFTKINNPYSINALLRDILDRKYTIHNSFITIDTIKDSLLQTVNYTKDVLSIQHVTEAIIKNTDVLSKFITAQLIINTDLVQSAYRIMTSYFTNVINNIAPIFYTITGLSKITVPIETEIHKIRVCTIGDSITAGHPNYWAESGTGNPQSQYQYWLQKRLGSEFEVLNNGYGSDTTLRCLNRFDRDVLTKNPQYVIIQAGTNDIYWAMAEKKDDQAYLDAKMEDAKLNIIEMVNRALANDIIPIVGTLIPRTTAQGIYRTGLWKYNDWIINYCNGRDGVYYADFYNAGKGNIPPMPLEDPTIAGALNPLYDGDSTFDQYGNLNRRGYGVHPNIVGYKLMAEAISLNIFNSLTSEVKIYLDAECTVAETQIIGNSYIPTFILDLKNMDRGRVKTTTRYLKNVGNKPVLYALYPTKEENMDIKFSLNQGEFKDNIIGKLDSQGIHTVDIKLDIPKFGDTPAIKLNLPIRSIKTN